MSFAEYMAGDRRLALLRYLDEAPEGTLNDSVLKTALAATGHPVARHVLTADLYILAEHGLIKIDTLPLKGGDLLIATIKEDGSDVAAGRRASPVVAKPSRRK